MKNSGQNPAIAKLGLLALTASFALGAKAAVVINEIDYDQPGTDSAELLNCLTRGHQPFH